MFSTLLLNSIFAQTISGTTVQLTEDTSSDFHTLTLTVNDSQSTFYLTEKTHLLSNPSVYDEFGNVIFTYSSLPRFYHGNTSHGSIALRQENDTYSGFVFDDSTLYEIVYDENTTEYSLQIPFLEEDESYDLTNDTIEDTFETISPTVNDNLSTIKYVEIGVVNDKERYLSGSSNVATVVKSTENIVNLVDSIYWNNNMNPSARVVLRKNIVWTTDVIVAAPSSSRAGSFDGSDYLAKWYAWSSANPMGVDSSVMMSGKDFAGVLGIARVGAMCASYASGFLSKAVIGSFTDAYSASIFAHEMGHSFSMRHDGSNNACSSGYLMWTSASRTSPRTIFSTCSKTYYTNYFNTVYNPTSSRQCLENSPVTPTNTPTPTITSTPTPTITSTPTPTTTSTPTPTITSTPTPTTTNTPTPTTTNTPTPTTTNTPTPTTTNTPIPTQLPPRSDARCGPSVGNPACRTGNCCSKYGWCGSTTAHCSGTNCVYQCA